MKQSNRTNNPSGDYQSANKEAVVDIAKYQNSEDKKNSESSAFEQIMSQMNIDDRKTFDLQYEKHWQQASDDGELLSVLICEIDFFKAYNDHYGYQGSAFMLLVISLALKNTCEKFNCNLAHYRDGEFAILIKGGDLETAEEIAESLRLAVEKSRTEHKLSKVSDVVTLSVGISSVYPTSMKALIQKSTNALLRAKKTGHNQVCSSIELKNQQNGLDSNTLEIKESEQNSVASNTLETKESEKSALPSNTLETKESEQNSPETNMLETKETEQNSPATNMLETKETEKSGLASNTLETQEPEKNAISSNTLETKEPQKNELTSNTLEIKEPEKSDLERLMSEARIYDRRDFNRYFVNAWQEATRDKELLSMIISEIDFFNDYTQHYGQKNSEDILLLVAYTLKTKCEEFDCFFARLSGEKFVVLVKGGNATKGLKVAKALHESVQELAMEHPTSPASRHLTMSLGLSNIFPSNENTMKSLMSKVDDALEDAKSSGYDQIKVS